MRSIIGMVLVLIFNQFAIAQSGNVHWNLEKGIALKGYDAVAYHTQKKPSMVNKPFPCRMVVLSGILQVLPTAISFANRRQPMNRLMVAGVPLPWAIMEKK